MSKKSAAFWEVFAVMIVLQGAKLLLEAIVSPLLPNIRFVSKMLTMGVMILLAGTVVLYAKLRGVNLPVFPERFSKWYVLSTILASVLLITAPSNFTGGFPTVMVLLYSSIVTPLYEELLFRGLIWSRLAPDYQGRYTICILTAFLFGFWHIGYMLPQLMAGNIFAVLSKAAVGLGYGLILGFVRLKTKNCYGTILLHGILNFFAF